MNLYRYDDTTFPAASIGVKVESDGTTITFQHFEAVIDGCGVVSRQPVGTGAVIARDDGSQWTPYDTCTLNFAALRGDATFADYTAWVHEVNALRFHNMFANTVNTKERGAAYAQRVKMRMTALAFLGFATDTLEDMKVVVVVASGGWLETTGFDGTIAVTTPGEARILALPGFTVSCAPSGPDVIATVQAMSFNPQSTRFDIPLAKSFTVFLESTLGQLSSPRITLDATGKGQVRVVGDPLHGGQTGRVKVGFKYFPGVADGAFTLPGAAA